MKLFNKYKTIYEWYIPIFDQSFYLWIWNQEEFTQFFETNFPNIPFNFDAKWTTYSASDGKLCLYLDTKDNYTMLHEVVHMTFHIIKHCWIDMWDDEEVFAYIYEYIVRMIQEKLNSC